MKRIALILALSLCAAIAVTAQDKPKQEAPKADAPKADAPKADAKPAPLPSVETILDKYLKAIGGKEAIEKLNSRSVKGTFEIEAMSMSGPFENYAKAPNKLAVHFSIPGVGNGAQVFDGQKAWDSNPMTGLRELGGEELAVMKREADFYRDLNLKSHYKKMEVKAKEKVGQAEAYVIEATPAEGSPEKLYFDAATGLLIRQDAERETGQGKLAIEIYVEEYKMVDGVNIPHKVRQVSPLFSMTIKFAEVKHNVEIDEAKFAKPSGN
jgi:outer membrane lipoprotein-sorting protein